MLCNPNTLSSFFIKLKRYALKTKFKNYVTIYLFSYLCYYLLIKLSILNFIKKLENK